MSLVQLFVNGTIVFADTTDEVDKLVVKVDGRVLLQYSNEPTITYCSANKHPVPVGYTGPCIYCLHAEDRNDERSRTRG